MLKVLQYYIFLLCLVSMVPQAQAQNKERIKYEGDLLESFKQDGETIRKLIGNVIFRQETTTVYCDSAYFYRKKNVMEGFGHVRIVDDSTVITSGKLIYEGDTRKTKLRENVIYTRGERKVFTDFLDYDLDLEIAQYFNGGKLIDETNVLTSEVGFYYAISDYAQFYKNVVLDAPDYVLKTDTLFYDTNTKIATTEGPTFITDEDETVLHSLGGVFRTEVEQSEFSSGQIETPDYVLSGDNLYFDDLRKYYKAVQNVKLTSKEDDIIITGSEGYYDKNKSLSKVYGFPLLKKIMEADTFYLTADTLVAIESDYDSLKRILAYSNVKMFKTTLQGIADSSAFYQQDSVMFFYGDPVMWNEKSQAIADTISIEVTKKELKKMNLLSRSFLIAQDTMDNFNQIKGRQMITTFKENQIDRIDVDGNGEILYYALEGDTSLMGMNKIFCASMKIFFANKKLTTFRVYTKPEAQFIPPHELTKEIQRLDNFEWRIDERPELYDLAYYLNPDWDQESIPKTTLRKMKKDPANLGPRMPDKKAPSKSTPFPAKGKGKKPLRGTDKQQESLSNQ